MNKHRSSARMLALALVALIALSCAVPALGETAATIKMAKTEGTVTVSNSSGKDLTVRDSMRLYNGNQIATSLKSYAWMDLDDTKLCKEDASSKVELRKSGSKLEVLVKAGSVFFNVTEDLNDDETLNIRTSTMVAGIRGTSGWVRVLGPWSSEIHVLEGTVVCDVADPNTNKKKDVTVSSGEAAVLTVDPSAQGEGRCTVTKEQFAPGDIEGYVLKELAGDLDLCGKIYEASGMDVLPPMGLLGSAGRQLDEARQIQEGMTDPPSEDALRDLQERLERAEELLEEAGAGDTARQDLTDANTDLENGDLQGALDSLDSAREDMESAQTDEAGDARPQAEDQADQKLQQDQDEAQREQEAVDAQTPRQDSETVTWEENYTPGPRTVSMDDVDIASLQEMLDDLINVGVTLIPSATPSRNSLDLSDGTLTVPAEQTLTVSAGIEVNVGAGSRLTVDGTMNVEGNLTNAGELVVNGSRTLTAAQITNIGQIYLNSGGHIGADVDNAGSLACYGRMDGGTVAVNGSGLLVVDGGSVSALSVSGGNVYASNAALGTVTVSGGVLEIWPGTTVGTVDRTGGEVIYR